MAHLFAFFTFLIELNLFFRPEFPFKKLALSSYKKPSSIIFKKTLEPTTKGFTCILYF